MPKSANIFIKPSKPNFNIDFEQLLHLPFNIYWKNREGYYLGCNDAMAACVNLNSRYNIVEKNLYDLVKKENADQVAINDIKVMNDNKALCLVETGYYDDGINDVLIPFLSIKTPMLNSDGNVNGLLGFSINLEMLDSSNLSAFMACLNMSQDSVNAFQELKRFYSNTTVNGIKLSQRELECINYIYRGKTAKEIARLLNISRRTVESHISHIKAKLNCRTKAELLDKLIEHKFYF